MSGNVNFSLWLCFWQPHASPPIQHSSSPSSEDRSRSPSWASWAGRAGGCEQCALPTGVSFRSLQAGHLTKSCPVGISQSVLYTFSVPSSFPLSHSRFQSIDVMARTAATPWSMTWLGSWGHTSDSERGKGGFMKSSPHLSPELPSSQFTRETIPVTRRQSQQQQTLTADGSPPTPPHADSLIHL